MESGKIIEYSNQTTRWTSKVLGFDSWEAKKLFPAMSETHQASYVASTGVKANGARIWSMLNSTRVFAFNNFKIYTIN
jgi:hypothetical protein